MKYVKMLYLLAVASAAVLMAFAGTASAFLTSPQGTTLPSGTKIKAKSEGATSLTGTITVTCQKSEVSGEIEVPGPGTAEGPIEALTFEECGNHTVTVTSKGKLIVHSIGNNTATVTSKGARVTVLLHSFLLGTVHCIYETNGLDIGTLTGTGHKNNSKTTATLDISSVSIPQVFTDGACGDHATWEGSYEVTSPDHLYID